MNEHYETLVEIPNLSRDVVEVNRRFWQLDVDGRILGLDDKW